MRKTLIVGATSAIAQATARLFAADGASLFLVARNEQKLNAVAEDLRVRGARQIETWVMDATDYDRHQEVIEEAVERLGGLDLVLMAHGTLPDQKACEASFEMTRREFETNALSVISLLTHVANYFEQEKQGTQPDQHHLRVFAGAVILAALSAGVGFRAWSFHEQRAFCPNRAPSGQPAEIPFQQVGRSSRRGR